MNILIASNEFPPYSHFGGLGTHVRVLAEGLVRAGHMVVVVSTHYRRSQLIEHNGLKVVLYDAREHAGLRVSTREFFASLQRTVLATLPGELQRLGFRPDVVHGHAPQMLWIAEELSRRFSAPLVATAHTSMRELAKATGRELSAEVDEQDRALCELPNRLICVSRTLQQTLCKDYNQTPKRVRAVINGVDACAAIRRTAKLRREALRAALAPGARKIVVQIGHLNAHKGLFATLESARRLASKHAGLKYLLAGPMDYRNRDRFRDELASDPRLDRAFRRMGMLRHENAMKLMAIADVVLFPTAYDACGYVALEAAAHGVPVIASAVGGVPEVVEHDVTGLLIPAHGESPCEVEVAALTDAQSKLLQDHSLSEKLGEQARERAFACFSQEKMALHTLACYREVI